MTWIGLLIAVILSPVFIIKKSKPKVFGHSIYFEIGKGGDGVNFGAVFFVNKGASERTKCHEHGHGLQNICWGVLFPFVIAIPSACRYWRRKLIRRKTPNAILEPYDSVWFEGQATEWGMRNYSSKIN